MSMKQFYVICTLALVALAVVVIFVFGQPKPDQQLNGEVASTLDQSVQNRASQAGSVESFDESLRESMRPGLVRCSILGFDREQKPIDFKAEVWAIDQSGSSKNLARDQTSEHGVLELELSEISELWVEATSVLGGHYFGRLPADLVATGACEITFVDGCKVQGILIAEANPTSLDNIPIYIWPRSQASTPKNIKSLEDLLGLRIVHSDANGRFEFFVVPGK